jgi:hypothetical protein
VCVGTIDELEELDELAAAVAINGYAVDRARQEIDPCHQAHGAMAYVLVIPREGWMFAGDRRPIRACVANRLDARLLVVREDGDHRGHVLALLAQQLDFLVDA